MTSSTTRRSFAENNQILKLLHGSRAYGIADENSDYDFISIFVEPPEYVFSKRSIDSQEFQTESPQGTAFSVRKFFSLAYEGNPNLLAILFSTGANVLESTELGREILAHRNLFVSQKAGPRYLGYMKNQRLRFEGKKKGHIPNRPHLVEKYGYDTKYAMHVIRLAFQGICLFDTGEIQIPFHEELRKILLDIRHGLLNYEGMLDYMCDQESTLVDAIDSTSLPQEPNYEEIYKLSQRIHTKFWSQQ